METLMHKNIKHEPKWEDICRSRKVPSISKGHMTLKVPFTVFRENRERVIQELRKMKPNAVVIIQAASPAGCFSNINHVQEFFWSFGYQQSEAIGAIDVLRGKSFLILPRVNSGSLERCEERTTRTETKKQYLVSGIWYLDELEIFLDYLTCTDSREILILDFQKRELPASISKYKVEPSILSQIIHNLMSYKTEKEIQILRYIARNLESALIHIIHRFRPGMTDNQLEAWYIFFMKYKSSFGQLKFCISSGDDQMDCDSYLRQSFISRQKRVFKEGELCLIEVGAAYFGHKLALGMVIPVSENFNSLQEKAYEATLIMRLSICNNLKVALPAECVRETAEKSLLKFLVESKLITGTVDGAFTHGIGRLFIQRRVIRSIDLDCEDITVLELGKTYLIQPGCSFIKRTLDEAYEDPELKTYLTPGLREYEGIVVRLSDPVIITTSGFRYLSNMPRASNIISDMRLEDESKKNDLTIQLEKQKLMVTPSLFSIS